MSADCIAIWKECLAELEKNPAISAVALDVFIRTLEPVTLHESNLILMSNSVHNKNIIYKNYLDKITEALQKVYPALGVAVINEDERDSIATSPALETIEAPVLTQSNLQEKYTFENFVVGQNNQFVHAAAKAVADNPGAAYNPLFIYGNVGLGKTHVMQAVGNAILARRPDYRIIYVTCENFINDFISSIRMGKDKNAAQSFRNRYRNCDMLMIDDIQFIAKKTGTQEELFHTFNDLHDKGKQIIFTSDRPPKEISPLEERLRSRFAAGLIADMQPPDYETRVAILQKKAALNNYLVSSEVLEYIADQNDDNVRTLEENLTRCYFYASLMEKPLTVEIAKQALRDTNAEEEQLDIDTIIEIVCRYYRVTRDDLVSKKKTKDIAFPRQMCIYLITEIMPVPLATIGSIFGGRDHTTIMHSRDKIAAELKQNPAIKTALSDIRNMIYKK